jgi:O-antigen/teichoic acid export membrane protein
MKTGTRVLVNAVTRWMATGIAGVIGLVLVPFLLHELGKAGYGLVALTATIVSLTMLVDMGMRAAAAKHLADQAALGNQGRYNEIASTAFCAFCGAGLVAAAGCAVFAGAIIACFKIPPSLTADAIFLVRWYAPGAILLQFIELVYAAILTSHNRFDLLNLVRAGSATVQAVLLFLFLGVMDTGLYGWATAWLASRSAAVLTMMVCAERVAPAARIRFGLARWRVLRGVLSLAAGVFILRACDLISLQTDPLVLTGFLGTVAVAIYRPGTLVMRECHKLAGVLKAQLHPLAAGSHATGRLADLRQILFRGTRYTLLMGVPACVFFGLFAEPVARLWLAGSLGADYVLAARVLAVWALIYLFSYAMGPQWAILLGMQRIRFLVVFRVITSVLNIAGSVILVGYTDVGILGVLIPTLVAVMLRWPILSAYTARAIGSSLWQFTRASIVRPLVVMLGLVLLGLGLRRVVAVDSWFELGACLFATGAAWMVLAWTVGFTGADRKQFREMLHGGLSLIRRRRGPVALEELEETDDAV